MDQKAVYEITIAEKLEQLSVPDVADAIWARIETQLDIDMPTDDGPSGGNSPAGGGFWNMAGIILFIAALIATIYFTNKKNPANNTDNTIDNSPAILTNPGTRIDKPPPLPVAAPRQSSNTAGQNTVPPPQVAADSANNAIDNQAIIPTVDSRIDSVANTAPLVISTTDTTDKKRRGVKGITDNDYRIVPERKDSAR